LYFDELRFDMRIDLQFAWRNTVPRFWSGTAPPGLLPDATEASPECLVNCEGAPLAGYMDAAARIKSDRDTVRDETRKAQVISNVRRAALDGRIPQDVVAEMWETLVEGSIAYELGRWDAIRG
jgi:hypothetical protein